MTVRIRSIGTALPEYSIAQEEAALTLQKLQITQRWGRTLPGLYRKSGVKSRSSVLLLNDNEDTMERQNFYADASQMPHGPSTSQRMKVYREQAGPLLEKACRAAAEVNDFSFGSVTHLVTVSCTGFVSPGVDHWLIRNLNLPLDVQRTHVGFMGCHGAINGLRVASAFAKSDPNAVVLLGAVELCSIHQQYTDDPQQLVANALFADGAAAVVLDSNANKSDQDAWHVVSSKSWMVANTAAHMGWVVGDNGFQMSLSAEVPAIIEAQLYEPVTQWLDTLGVKPDDIDLWAVHPGGPRILDAVVETFGLSEESVSTSREVLSTHGNMSSPTVLFILDRLSAQCPSAKYCLLVAFGPGLHAELMLLARD